MFSKNQLCHNYHHVINACVAIAFSSDTFEDMCPIEGYEIVMRVELFGKWILYVKVSFYNYDHTFLDELWEVGGVSWIYVGFIT